MATSSMDAMELMDCAKDYSGYIREAAIARCVRLARVDLLPILTGCLNDWVPQVSTGRRDDIVVALQAIRLCADLSGDQQKEQYRVALRSSFGPVRAAALRWILAFDEPSGKEQTAVEALWDVQASVRTLAIEYLTARHFDLRGYYHAKIADAQSKELVRIGLTALTSLRNADDVPFIKKYATAKQSIVRATAFSSWAKLDPSAKDAIACEALRDRSARVRKVALQLVRKQGAYVSFELVHIALMRHRDYRLLLAFAENNKWTWLESIAKIVKLDVGNQEMRLFLTRDIRRWIGKASSRYERPSEEQVTFFSSEEVAASFFDLLNREESLMARLKFELPR